ncbi:MAG: CBS domain-containing protein [Candidatus Bilamarchaeaceae archaeon]
MGTDLKVGDIMTKKVIIIPYGKDISEAAKLMKRYSIGSVIVVEDEKSKKARGIITERDIVYKVIAKRKDPYTTKVEEIMSKPLRVIRPDTPIEEASKAMRDNKIKRLPVVNEYNELLGIISEGDVTKIFPLVVDLIEEKAALK